MVAEPYSSLSAASLLRMMVETDSSDLHLKAGIPPILRINGELQPQDLPPLKPSDLESVLREIANEEQRANIADPSHFAYPTYARAARTRRDNILASLTDLRGQVEEAEAQFKEASEELAKVQNQDARDRGAERMVDVVAERRQAEGPHAFRRGA